MPRALALAWVYVAHSDSTVSAQHVQGDRRRLPVGRAAEDRRTVGAAVAAALRADRESAPHRGAGEPRARDAPDRQRRRRPRAGDAGRRRRPQAILADYAAHARDTTFATQLLYRLRDGSQNAGKALIWLENELEKSGTDAEEIIIGEHHTLSRGNVTTGNIIRGLRLINDIDWTEWFEDVSRIDALLRERSDFAALDFPSRDQYRTGDRGSGAPLRTSANSRSPSSAIELAG